MEDVKTETVGLQVIANGIIQAIQHYILADQLEKQCERKDAIVDALSLLSRIQENLAEEAKDGPKGTGAVSEEDSKA